MQIHIADSPDTVSVLMTAKEYDRWFKQTYPVILEKFKEINSKLDALYSELQNNLIKQFKDHNEKSKDEPNSTTDLFRKKLGLQYARVTPVSDEEMQIVVDWFWENSGNRQVGPMMNNLPDRPGRKRSDIEEDYFFYDNILHKWMYPNYPGFFFDRIERAKQKKKEVQEIYKKLDDTSSVAACNKNMKFIVSSDTMNLKFLEGIDKL